MKALIYVLTEPRDALVSYAGRFACRVFGRHGVTCEGRADHQHLRIAQHARRAMARTMIDRHPQ